MRPEGHTTGCFNPVTPCQTWEVVVCPPVRFIAGCCQFSGLCGRNDSQLNSLRSLHGGLCRLHSNFSQSVCIRSELAESHYNVALNLTFCCSVQERVIFICFQQGSHAVLKVLKKYCISKSVFKTLKKYWIWPKCRLGIEKVWKFQMEKIRSVWVE